MKVLEAEEKVCPFMNGFSYFQNGTLNTNLTTKCICGDCMAWVTTKTHSDTRTESYVYETAPDKNGNTHHSGMRPILLPIDEQEGYCARLEMR